MNIVTLDDFLKEEELNNSEVHESNTAIINDEQANIYLKLLAEATLEENKIQAEANKKLDYYKELIEKWRVDSSKRYTNAIKYYTDLLEAYVTSKRNNKTGTEKLLYGKLSIKKQLPKYEYESDDVIASELKNIVGMDGLVKYTPTINKVDLKKAGTILDNKFTINGKVLNSVKVEERPNKVVINIDDTLESLKTDIQKSA